MGLSGSARSRLRDFALLAASTAASLGLLELGLQLAVPIYDSPYQLQEEFLIEIGPHSRKVFQHTAANGGTRIVSEFNAAGFRGAELAPDPRTERRLMIYGDSFVQAEFSEVEATFPVQLEHILETRLNAGFEVINAGVVGYGPDQVAVRLPRDIERWRPDLLVLVLYAGNDFGDVVRNGIFTLDASGALQRHRPRLETNIRARIERVSDPPWWRRPQIVRHAASRYQYFRALLANDPSNHTTATTYVEYSFTQSLLLHQRILAHGSGARVAENPFFDYFDADIAFEGDSPSARYKIRLMQATAAELARIALVARTPLAVLVVPPVFDAARDSDYSVDTGRHPGYVRERLSSLAADITTSAGLPTLDLFPALDALDAKQYYLRGADDHWNDAGQALAAQTFADFLIEGGLLTR
jgi:hypothetical protein